jgi:hypothetical protein
MKKVTITLELETVDKESVYSYIQSLIEDDSLNYDIESNDSKEPIKRHPLADF